MMTPCAPDTFRRADDRAEVVRILDLVEDDDKGLFTALFGESEDILHGGILLHRAECRDPLMRRAARHEVQLFALDLLYGDTGFFGFGGDLHRGAGWIALGDHHLDDRASRAERFGDRVASDQQLVVLIRLILFVIHRHTYTS